MRHRPMSWDNATGRRRYTDIHGSSGGVKHIDRKLHRRNFSSAPHALSTNRERCTLLGGDDDFDRIYGSKRKRLDTYRRLVHSVACRRDLAPIVHVGSAASVTVARPGVFAPLAERPPLSDHATTLASRHACTGGWRCARGPQARSLRHLQLLPSPQLRAQPGSCSRARRFPALRAGCCTASAPTIAFTLFCIAVLALDEIFMPPLQPPLSPLNSRVRHTTAKFAH